MSSYNVFVDRNRDQLHIHENNIYLPFRREGELWDDLQHPAKATSEGQISPEAQDLVDFSTAILHLDRICLREEREKWVRTIHLKIGLRNPAAFNSIADDLRWALSVLGGDNFTFDITTIRTEQQTRTEGLPEVENWTELTDVALLSGGQDSLTGAARLFSNGANPLLVRVNTRDKANLTELTNKLRRKFNREPAFYSQPVGSPVAPNEGKKAREPSQRLRSFYFLSVGTVLAKSHEIQRLHINENGIMAIHLPLDPARSSTFSTRTAYPQFLHLFQNIMRRWQNHQIEIVNAFALNTKSEVVAECNAMGVTDALEQTVSCAHSATIQQTVKRQRSKNYLMAEEASDLHCGYCFPCLLRRISMWNAGLQTNDVTYATDPFKVLVDGSSEDYKFVYEASTAVLGLIRLTMKFENPDFISIISEYPQIAESASVLGDGSMQAIIDLHKRFAIEVKRYMHANAPYLEFLFDPQRSRQLEAQVIAIASDQMLDAILVNADIEATDGFYKEMSRLFNLVRLRIQVALADGSMTQQQIEEMLSNGINSVIAGRTPPIKFTIAEGRDIKRATWDELRSRRCPPFW